jgi:hypothetical protein
MADRKSITHVGLDVYKEGIVVAVATGGLRGEVERATGSRPTGGMLQPGQAAPGAAGWRRCGAGCPARGNARPVAGTAKRATPPSPAIATYCRSPFQQLRLTCSPAASAVQFDVRYPGGSASYPRRNPLNCHG